MKRRKIDRRRLAFESLEPRTVLSASFPTIIELQITPPPPPGSDNQSIPFQSAPDDGGGTFDTGIRTNTIDIIGVDWRIPEGFQGSQGAGAPSHAPAHYDDIRAEPVRVDDIDTAPSTSGFAGLAPSPSPNQNAAGINPRQDPLPLVSDMRLHQGLNDKPSNEGLLSEGLPNLAMQPALKDIESAAFASLGDENVSGDASNGAMIAADNNADLEPNNSEKDEPTGHGNTSLIWQMALAGWLTGE
jgi:hypothetical protein